MKNKSSYRKSKNTVTKKKKIKKTKPKRKNDYGTRKS